MDNQRDGRREDEKAETRHGPGHTADEGQTDERKTGEGRGEEEGR